MTLERALTKSLKADAIEYLQEHPEDFEKTLRICLSDAPTMCWRAAWMVNSSMDQNDERVTPFVDDILSVLANKEAGHQRELIKILRQMDLTESQDSQLYDHCVTLWESVRLIPSVRLFAFRVMMDFVKKYPELRTEISALTQQQYLSSLSPGIRRSIEKTIRKWEGAG